MTWTEKTRPAMKQERVAQKDGHLRTIGALFLLILFLMTRPTGPQPPYVNIRA